jgi:hypothetical protein
VRRRGHLPHAAAGRPEAQPPGSAREAPATSLLGASWTRARGSASWPVKADDDTHTYMQLAADGMEYIFSHINGEEKHNIFSTKKTFG